MRGNHWSTDPPRLHFEPLKPLNFDFNADLNRNLDPAFHSYVNPDPDLDPASKNNADPCGVASETLFFKIVDVFFKELFSAISVCLKVHKREKFLGSDFEFFTIL